MANAGDWLILHGGALGDLALTIQFALRLPGVGAASVLRVISRVGPGDFAACAPRVERVSADGLPLHWLFETGTAAGGRAGSSGAVPAPSRAAAPARLRELIGGWNVLNALTGPDTGAHDRLVSLGPRTLCTLDTRPDPGSSRHITEQWAARLRGQARLGARGQRLRLAPPASEFTADRRVDVLIHPGSGGRAKCWPLDRFVAAGQALLDAGRSVRFLVGPVELDLWSERRLSDLRERFPLLECSDAGALGAALAACRVFLSNDCGPAHVAALLGRPTVTLFGPTSPDVWRPLSRAGQALRGDVALGPEWGLAPGVVAGVVASALDATPT